jgi:hypothetical protein
LPIRLCRCSPRGQTLQWPNDPRSAVGPSSAQLTGLTLPCPLQWARDLRIPRCGALDPSPFAQSLLGRTEASGLYKPTAVTGVHTRLLVHERTRHELESYRPRQRFSRTSTLTNAQLTTSRNMLDLDSILSQLTLVEKISLLTGSDMWHTTSLERLQIPPVRMTDGRKSRVWRFRATLDRRAGGSGEHDADLVSYFAWRQRSE